MGAYGAGMSVYTHFIARAARSYFPKDTAMDIGVATRPKDVPPKPDPTYQKE